MILLLLLLMVMPAHAQVADGQAVNQTITNNAFLKRSVDDVGLGRYTLQNTNPVSGAAILNLQREVNSTSYFTGKPANGVYNLLPLWNNNDVGSSTDNLKGRADLLTAKFNGATGHGHTGASGDGPQITNAGISSSAAIARNKLSLGVSYQVVTNDAFGVMSGVSPGTSGYVLTSDGTQWISAPAASAPPTILTFTEQISDPSPPSAGFLKLYAKTDDKFYQEDSTATVTQVGTGGGGGGGGVVRFAQNGGLSVTTDIDSPHRFSAAASIATVSVAILNSGTSGTTSFTVNQYRAGSLLTSVTGSVASAAGAPYAGPVTLSSALSVITDDLISVDLNAVATASENISIEIDSGSMTGPTGPPGSAGTMGIYALSTKTANYTALLSDDVILCDATGGSFTITLPTAVGVGHKGKFYNIKQIDSSGNKITIMPFGGELIDKETSQTLDSFPDSITIVSDNANWYIL